MASPYSIKVYLMWDECSEPEIKRLSGSDISNYETFVKIIEVMYPDLAGKLYKIYWKDDEDELILISSQKELTVAIEQMKTELKKFYVIVKSSTCKDEADTDVVHPHVYCDGCSNNISGFRYKCIVCENFDLCMDCEKAAVHYMHPMLRIPKPFMFEQSDLRKIVAFSSSLCHCSKFDQGRHSRHHHHHRRRHSHDSKPEFVKKRKSDKQESGQETDDSEDGCYKKHSHKKWKKMNRCPYSHLMKEVFHYFDPSPFSPEPTTNSECGKKCSEKSAAPDFDMSYLHSVGNRIAALLNPLGIDVDFELRGKNKNTNEEAPKETPKETPAATNVSSTPSAPPLHKEVRFASTAEEKGEATKEVEEITKKLNNQTLTSGDNDWVDFEELKRQLDEPEKPSSSGTIPKASPSKETAPQGEGTSAGGPSSEGQKLYPTLMHGRPRDSVIREALEKMLAMGFTNDGDWLTHLLEAKNGDINQALEVLAPHKK